LRKNTAEDNRVGCLKVKKLVGIWQRRRWEGRRDFWRRAGFLESARAGYFEGGRGEFLEQQEWEALNRKRMEGWVGR
jgi:hypothetical protein